MDNQENEIFQAAPQQPVPEQCAPEQPAPQQPAPQQPAPEQPAAQPQSASQSQWQPWQQPAPQPGYYHGAGVGYREVPSGAPRQPWQQPQWQSYQQPWQQPAPQPSKPAKEKKGGKIFRTILCAVLILALVIGACAVTASVCNRYWQQQNELLKQNMNDKLNALQQQIDDKLVSVESGGTLGEAMSATVIYRQNVASVVAITCTIRYNNNGQTSTTGASGTGFVITEDGYIVTNHHVIENASKITVTMADGTEYAAKLIGSNDTNDVALIKITATGLDAVTIGSSSAMQVGDQVVAIGNALGELSSSLTVGYVSGMDRDVSTDGTIINMIQTDAAINSGNSGGPLFNARGEVIGITTAKYSGTTSSGASIEGISFAIPMDDVIDMIQDLQEYGYIRSAFLGVRVWEVDAAVAATYDLPQGVYVEEVTPGYCAEKAGVQAKDIIVELGGYSVRTMNDLSRALRSLEAGDTVTMVVWRSGQQVMLTITLDEKPAA